MIPNSFLSDEFMEEYGRNYLEKVNHMELTKDNLAEIKYLEFPHEY